MDVVSALFLFSIFKKMKHNLMRMVIGGSLPESNLSLSGTTERDHCKTTGQLMAAGFGATRT